MALLVAFGLMNVLAMAGLVSVVLAEKYWRHGVVLSRAVGIAALIAAVAVFWVPGLAPGLRHSMTMM
jgi:predicted metal-binding membrane protein